MKIGYAGNGPLSTATVERLSRTHHVVVFASSGDSAAPATGAVSGTAGDLRGCDAILLSLDSHAAVRELLLGSRGIAKSLSRGKIVIDMTPADPDATRALSHDLQSLGLTLLDAPIHCERVEELSNIAAIMCGGPADALEFVRPALEALCPEVIHCGESGHGQATKIVVSAVAACNRLITYECACVGIKAGLSAEHMAAVFNKSSGYNSATARVLPGLATSARTSDVSLAASLAELTLASKLAMRVGAPVLIANHVTAVTQAAASQFGDDATVDTIARLFEASSGIKFAARDTSHLASA